MRKKISLNFSIFYVNSKIMFYLTGFSVTKYAMNSSKVVDETSEPSLSCSANSPASACALQARNFSSSSRYETGETLLADFVPKKSSFVLRWKRDLILRLQV